MTDLSTRVRTALGNEWEASRSPWEGLIRLYESDAEVFYLLAREGLEQADSLVEPLASLVQRIRTAIRASYRLVRTAGGDGQVETQTDRLPVPAELFSQVRQFLLEIDGKGVNERKGKDYEGRVVSEAEDWFKLGEPESTIKDQLRAKERREARPIVFRVSQQDFDSLKSQPTYVSHNLHKCVRKTVLAPTAIYQGLNRGDKAPQRLREGWAICGKPNRACNNTGYLEPLAKLRASGKIKSSRIDRR
jgi:hypothetical protein